MNFVNGKKSSIKGGEDVTKKKYLAEFEEIPVDLVRKSKEP
jgi:hypothetical protein